MALGIYLLKVMLCSAFLYLYYLGVLKNRKFHQYNRFYLLLVAILSWVLPLLKIELSQEPSTSVPVVYEMVKVIAEGNSDFEQLTVAASPTIDWSLWLVVVLGVISSLILSGVVYSLLKIYRLLKTHPSQRTQGIQLIMTEEKGTPFSFFRFVFWHKSIHLRSTIGRQMLAHELVHVREKHSSDKLFMECLMIIGWFNPVFWFLKKELYLIHEFIADQKSIENRDASILATLLLTAAYPQQQNLLSHPFFFSPIKRRIAMLTHSTSPKSSYLRRLLILPLLSLLVMLSAFRIMKISDPKVENGLDKKYTILIDVAHGGTMSGAISRNGDKEIEKDLCLSISRKLNALNSNSNIELVFTRESDVMVPHVQRVQQAAAVNADLLVSIHVNAAMNAIKKGLEVYLPKASHKYYQQSAELGLLMHQSLKGLFTSNGIKTRTEGIYILDHAPCPAVLVQTGYLTNSSDLEIIKNRQDEIAAKILEGVKAYLSNSKLAQKPEQTPVTKYVNEKTRLYDQLVKEFCIIEVKGNDTLYKGRIPVERQVQIDSLYEKMSKEERQQCFLILFMRTAPKLKPHMPTADEFERFRNASVYGIWVDGKHVPNTELSKYKHTDFANFFASRIYGAARKGRSYAIQVNLETKVYFERQQQETSVSQFRSFKVRSKLPWVKVTT